MKSNFSERLNSTILITTIIFSINAHAQSKDTNKSNEIEILREEISQQNRLTQEKFEEIKMENIALRKELEGNGDSIKILLSKINSDQQKLEFEKSIETGEALIKKQNYLLSGFSTYYTYLTILIGLLTLGLPLLVWIFGIRPARQALKKAKKKFNAHLKEYRIEQINESIENLKSGNSEIVDSSVNFIISLIPSYKFRENQLYKMYMISKYENISVNTRENLSFILMNHNYPFCKDYFFSIIRDNSESIDTTQLKNYSFNYLMKFHKNQTYLLNMLKELIINDINSNKEYNYITILGWCIPDHTEIFWKLLSFKPLVEEFNSTEINSILEAFRDRSDIISLESSEQTSEKEKLKHYNKKLNQTLVGQKNKN
ncbi:hypothetical protein [uncultured Christiangramia sp.]|uniref:hypothetical protein n=1 Tax=Christiangramia sp. 3-2217-3z TaxID=3417564 RepID=UPI00261F8850|nr:hypothetical protein [uncultured Christiangramia sp.]